MKEWLLVCLCLLPLLLAGRLLFFSALDPVSWRPSAAPAMNGVLAPNTALQSAEFIARGKIRGPEDIAIDAQGRIVTGLADGRVVRIEGEAVVTLVNTGGRPLGMAYDSSGNLVICDAAKGLLSLSPQGELTSLLTAVDGQHLNFANDLAIARDGKIYFTDSSTRYLQKDYWRGLLEGRPYGRLYVYDPASGNAKLLLKDLHFANGVTLSRSEDAVFIAETYRYRLRKFWLSGPHAGRDAVVADNLPGSPDNINNDGNGLIWVALPGPRHAFSDFSARHAWVRNLMFRFPKLDWPRPAHYGLVVAVDEDGRLVKSLHDPSAEHMRMITSVYPFQGRLYFGSYDNDRIGRL